MNLQSPAHRSENMPLMIIEDRSSDVAQAAIAVGRLGISDTRVIRDGQAALHFLEQVREGSVARPELIVLDLELPHGSGHEVLRYCRTYDALRDIPIIVWSMMADNIQQEICLAMGARAYIVKDDDYVSTLQRAVREILDPGEKRVV